MTNGMPLCMVMDFVSRGIIMSCEDPHTTYVEIEPTLRLIYRDGEYVGWYNPLATADAQKVTEFRTSISYTKDQMRYHPDLKDWLKRRMEQQFVRYLHDCKAIAFEEWPLLLGEGRITATLKVVMPEKSKP